MMAIWNEDFRGNGWSYCHVTRRSCILVVEPVFANANRSLMGLTLPKTLPWQEPCKTRLPFCDGNLEYQEGWTKENSRVVALTFPLAQRCDICILLLTSVVNMIVSHGHNLCYVSCSHLELCFHEYERINLQFVQLHLFSCYKRYKDRSLTST